MVGNSQVKALLPHIKDNVEELDLSSTGGQANYLSIYLSINLSILPTSTGCSLNIGFFFDF